jgi:uncharacterized protein YggE
MMKSLLAAAMIASLLSPIATLSSQSQGPAQSESESVHGNVITASRAGTAFAKPDLGILIMAIRSTAALVQDAASENAAKAKSAVAALAALGYPPERYKLTSVVFGRPQVSYYGQMQPEPEVTGYEASQLVYVFFEGPDLSDTEQLSQKEAAAIEALRKAGAVPNTLERPAPPQAQTEMIVYTVKDSDPYEQQALQQALERARQAAMDIAKSMQVQVTGLNSVRTGFLTRAYPLRAGLTPIEGLPYRFYSARSDQVEISASATVEYSFK